MLGKFPLVRTILPQLTNYVNTLNLASSALLLRAIGSYGGAAIFQ